MFSDSFCHLRNSMKNTTGSLIVSCWILAGRWRIVLEVCRITNLFRGVDKNEIWGEKTGYFSVQIEWFDWTICEVVEFYYSLTAEGTKLDDFYSEDKCFSIDSSFWWNWVLDTLRRSVASLPQKCLIWPLLAGAEQV